MNFYVEDTGNVMTLTREGTLIRGNLTVSSAHISELEVNGNILAIGDVILSGADCAEDFEIDGSMRALPLLPWEIC